MSGGKCCKKKVSKKLFSLSMVVAMALAVGVSAFAPMSVSAATCPKFKAGQVVKVTNKNVYYLVGSQGELKKYINTEALLTWQPNVSKVVKAKAECLKNVATGDDVGYRHGSRIVKFEKKFYAVGPNKTLFELATPAIAKSIYGANWKAYSRNISRAIFSQYTVGTAVEAGILHDGMLVKKAGTKTVYYVENGSLKKVLGTLSAAARNDVRSLNAKMFAKLDINDSYYLEAKEVVSAPESLNVVAPVAVEPSVSLSPLPSPHPVPPETTSSDNESKSNTVDGRVYQGTNYTGSFPAPEGIVLNGYSGKNEYKEPSGSGPYRFRILTAAARDLACSDKTRTVSGSKGASWEAGYFNGRSRGQQEAREIIPVFDDKPVNVSGNAALYSEGYYKGYAETFNGQQAIFYNFCDEFVKPDLTQYDEDGWHKNTEFSSAPNVTAVYLPERGVQYEKDPSNPKSLLSTTNVNSWSMPGGDNGFNKTSLNTSKSPLNFSRIDLYESDYDAGEAAMALDGDSGMTKAVSDAYQNIFKTNYTLKTHCSLTPADISYQAYGGKQFGLITYVSICQPVGWTTYVWKIHAFAVTQIPSSKTWLITSFVNNDNVKAKDKDELDLTKATMSSDFIGQFLGKLKLK